MEWNEKLQQIIDYIEHHLQRKEEPVDPGEIARIAGCSFSFFQKVFSYMNGISLSEYVRFRKLTLAGYDLKSTDMKVVDISYKYGYESPTSFTKAFQNFHGISPKEARNPSARLQVYPKMQVFVKQQYSWRIEQHPPMRLIGKRTQISVKDNIHFEEIPAFWDKCQKNGIFAALISLDTGTPPGMFSLFENYDEHAGKTDYMITVCSDKEPPEGFNEIILPEAAWAVFDLRGPVPGAVQNGWKYLNEEWIVNYPFKHAALPELEWYSSGNSYSEDYVSQIWIPIIEEE